MNQNIIDTEKELLKYIEEAIISLEYIPESVSIAPCFDDNVAIALNALYDCKSAIQEIIKEKGEKK